LKKKKDDQLVAFPTRLGVRPRYKEAIGRGFEVRERRRVTVVGGVENGSPTLR
jgi:hypothetical protein